MSIYVRQLCVVFGLVVGWASTVACSGSNAEESGWHLRGDAGPDASIGDDRDSSERPSNRADGEGDVSSTRSCQSLREVPVDDAFRKVDDVRGTWRRRLPAFEQGCGLYRPIVRLERTPSGRWSMHVRTHAVCNVCQQTMSPLYNSGASTFLTNAKRFDNTRVRPMLELEDTEGRTFPIGCSEIDAHPEGYREMKGMVGPSETLEPDRAERLEQNRPHASPYVEFVWDGRDSESTDRSAHTYYEDPVDYTSLDHLHLWWYRLVPEPKRYDDGVWPDACETGDGDACKTHFIQFCEVRGFDIPGLDLNVPPRKYMVRQTIDFESFPPPLQKQLERRQRRAEP
jgi:hypothetical protein